MSQLTLLNLLLSTELIYGTLLQCTEFSISELNSDVNASAVALILGPSQAYRDHFAMMITTLIAGAATAVIVWTALKCVDDSNGYLSGVRLAAAHFLVYLLSGVPSVPPSPLTSPGKICDRNGRRRVSLSLDMSLEQDLFRFSPRLSMRESRVQKPRKHLSPPISLNTRAVFQLGGPGGRSLGVVTTAEFKQTNKKTNKQEKVVADTSKPRHPVKKTGTGRKPNIRDMRRLREELLNDDEAEARNLDVHQSMEDYGSQLEQVYLEEASYQKESSRISVNGAFECQDGFDWEVEEPRAARPASGRPMDGLDVGHLPSRTLQLPRPALPPRQRPPHGWVVMSSAWDAPSVCESQVTAHSESQCHHAPVKQGDNKVALRLEQAGGTKVGPSPDG